MSNNRHFLQVCPCPECYFWGKRQVVGLRRKTFSILCPFHLFPLLSTCLSQELVLQRIFVSPWRTGCRYSTWDVGAGRDTGTNRRSPCPQKPVAAACPYRAPGARVEEPLQAWMVPLPSFPLILFCPSSSPDTQLSPHLETMDSSGKLRSCQGGPTRWFQWCFPLPQEGQADREPWSWGPSESLLSLGIQWTTWCLSPASSLPLPRTLQAQTEASL